MPLIHLWLGKISPWLAKKLISLLGMAETRSKIALGQVFNG